MKFAHLADVHLGGWREPKLREANTRSFCTAMQKCIMEKVDFVLIAGDFFNTALPAMDVLKTAVQKLKELKDAGIPVYFIPGSHDFSPSGKTMLDVIEEAGLAKNVARGEAIDGKLKLEFTTDKKTGVKLTGIPGRKGQLEKHAYYELQKEPLEAEPGPKIFLFHSPIAELRPEELAGMDAMPVSMLPKGFDYYAGGHVHVVQQERLDGYTNIVYPGPVFPNNFSELEKLECGRFVIWENGNVRHEKILLHPVVKIKIDANGKTALQVNEELKQQKKYFQNAIVLVRIEGILSQGKPAEIRFREFSEESAGQGAYIALKNTHKLESQEFEEVAVSTAGVDEIEENLIKEHAGQLKLLPKEKEIILVKEIMKMLGAEKAEGERISDFEKRISDDVDKLLGI